MTNIIPFILYIFATTFSPGPNNILSMTHGIHAGYKKTLGFLAGVCSGFFIIMLVCGLVNVALQSFIPSVEIWLQVLAAIYLVYLALHVLRSKPADDTSQQSGLNNFRTGFIMQFINFKVILYGTTIYSLFIIQTYHDMASILAFALMLTLNGFVATSCWALGGTLLRTLMRTHYHLINYVLAGMLFYTAIVGLFGAHGMG